MTRDFQDGADVKKGDVAFPIDPRPYQAAVDQAKAQAALDQVTLKRQTDLRSKGVNAPQDYDLAVANAQKAQAAAEAAQVNLDFCYIKSPINGRMRFAQRGHRQFGRSHQSATRHDSRSRSDLH